MRKNCPDVDYLSVLAMRAGEIILQYFQADSQIEWKKDETPVTIADRKISDLVIASFACDFPHISIITEEGSNEIPDAEYIGLCDPLDGTTLYMSGVPLSAFSFALLRNFEPIICVIYDPFLKRLWVGIKDKASTLNGKPVKVSDQKGLKRSKLCILNWTGVNASYTIAMQKAGKKGAFCINPASVSYFGGLVASGLYDGIMFPGEYYWEALAIALLVEGAGGKTTDAFGNKIVYNPYKSMNGMFSSNSHLHDKLLDIFWDD